MRQQRKASPDVPPFTATAGFVWAEYHHFLTRPAPPDDAEAKAFAGRHAAARTALGHLEHLLKLACAHGPAEPADDLRWLTQQARREIAELPPEEAPNDDAA